MAVGRADRGRRAVRDDRDDVFEDGDGGVGNRGGSIVVAAIPILFFNAEAQRRRVRRGCFGAYSLRSYE